MEGFILPSSSGNNKEQPIATICSSYTNASPNQSYTGMSESYTENFSVVKVSGYDETLTCDSSGKYKIVAFLRCRYCFYDIYVNSVQKLRVNGGGSMLPASGKFTGEITLDLNAGDVIKATIIPNNGVDYYGYGFLEIFTA